MSSIRAECFIIADGAQESNGKLYVLGGGWDTIFSAAYPMQWAAVSLAIKLVIPWNLAGEPHELVVDLVNDDGVPALPESPKLQFNVGRPHNADPGDDVSMPFTLTLNQITLPRTGRYTFLLRIDGAIIARTSFRATRPPAQE